MDDYGSSFVCDTIVVVIVGVILAAVYCLVVSLC